MVVIILIWASLLAQRLKRLPAMRDTRVRSLGQKISWRRKWQPTPVFLPGESHGCRSLVGYSLRGRKESDTTEQLHFHFPYYKTINFILFLIQIYYFRIRIQVRAPIFYNLHSSACTNNKNLWQIFSNTSFDIRGENCLCIL